MITEQHKKEGISQAYTRAIVNAAGYMLGQDQFDYGMDGTIHAVTVREEDRRFIKSGISIDYQLKATCNVTIETDYLVYDLEAKNYNDLIEDNLLTSRILILYTLPRNCDEWVNIVNDSNYTILKNCGWWCSLKGLERTSNANKKRIRIPIDQKFTPDSVNELMLKAGRSEDL